MFEENFLKLLLISPPQTYPIDLKNEYQSYLPVGILCLAAVAEQQKCKVKVLDCLETEHFEEENGKIIFGHSLNFILNEIDEFNPDIIGISNPFTMFIEDANRVANAIKKRKPNCIVILGGVSASIKTFYLKLIQESYYDIIVKGEGEETFKEIIQNYNNETKKILNLKKIKGIVYKINNKIIDNLNRPFIENLSDLPPPALHLIDLNKIFSNKYYSRWRLNQLSKKSLPVFTSRGCPFTCVFCSVHSQVGYRYRIYTNEYVINYIKSCIDKYGVTHFHFEDDNLTCNKDRAKKLIRELIKLNITWDTPNGVRADTIDEEMITLMIESGMTSISIASESGNDDVLKNVIKKHMSTKSIIKVACLADKYDLPCNVFFVLGFPGETIGNILDTIKFAKNLTKNYGTINHIFIANPLPGTELEKIAIEHNYIKKTLTSDDYFKAIRINQDSIIETPDFNKKIIFDLLKKELENSKYSVHGSSIPMFWYDNDKTWKKIYKLFPKISRNKHFIWEWE